MAGLAAGSWALFGDFERQAIYSNLDAKPGLERLKSRSNEPVMHGPNEDLKNSTQRKSVESKLLNAFTLVVCWLYAVFSLCHFYNLKLQAIHPFEMKKVTALGATNDMIILIVVPKCTDFEELALLVKLLELVEVADFWKAPQGAMRPLVLERPEI